MYRRMRWEYGNVIEYRKSHAYLCNRAGEKRIRKSDKDLTPEQRQKKTEKLQRHNEIESIKQLDRILVANFTDDDQHVVLTYKDGEVPTVEGSRKELNNFLNRTRRFFKRHEIEFKYVIVTEWNSKRIHHHIVCNSIPGVNMAKEIQRLWGHGGSHLTPLYQDKDFQKLAEYLVKETKKTFRDDNNPYKQRYSCSRNLIRPIAEMDMVKANSWSGQIKVPAKLQDAGYYLDRDSVRTWMDWEGYLNCEYKFVKPTAEQLKREAKQKKISDSYAAKYINSVKLKEYKVEQECDD